MQAADCAVVELDDGCGNVGLGEAAPFSAITGENLKNRRGNVGPLRDDSPFVARTIHQDADS